MSITRLKIENLSKQYRLGQVGTGTLSHDLNRFWHKIRGKEDPYSLVGAENDRSKAAESNYVWALQDINLEVKEGEVLGIIGKNGAGKSTLLKILSQVTGPTTGEIKINGRIGSLLEVGTGMHPELTGRENIYLNGAILGMSKAEIRKNFDAIVDFAGIAAYADTPFKRYSSGMRVRLGFAVAAFLEPEILIVDEVLAVGDAEFQRKAIGKMKEISGGHGRTVLFVSHNMASISNLCNRVVVLKNGKVAFNGSTEEGIDYYLKQNYGQQEIHDLENRTDRNTRGRFKFTGIKGLDYKGDEVFSFVSGKDYHFQLDYKTMNEVELIGMRILVSDSSGVNRLVLNGAFVSSFPINIPGKQRGQMKFSIPNFPLPQGDYTLQLSAYSLDGVEDDIENANRITCEGGDFFKTGKVPSVKDGVLIPYNFEIVC